MIWNRWKEKDSEFKGWTAPSFAHLRYWQFLTNRVLTEISPCELLLDVGCGKGSFLGLATESQKCVTAIGIDPNTAHLRLIHGKSIYRVRAVGENLPLKDCIVDAVIVKSMLDHVRDPQQVLREMCRVATNDSQLYVFQGVVKNSRLPPSYTHMRKFTTTELHSLLEVARLKILRKKTFYSMRLKRILMLIPRIYDFLSRFLGHESNQLIIATKGSRVLPKSLDVGCGHSSGHTKRGDINMKGACEDGDL